MTSFLSVGDRLVSLKTGIDWGPVTIASYMCLPLTLRRLGACLPRVSAPPEPTKLWHIAQLTLNSSLPRAMSPSPLVYWPSGTAGPGLSEATYAARDAICSSVYLTVPLGEAWMAGPASGIRPVPTWKSTAAAPTPTRLGAALLPSACRPWQVAQLARNNFLPAVMSSAVATEACAGLGARRE